MSARGPRPRAESFAAVARLWGAGAGGLLILFALRGVSVPTATAAAQWAWFAAVVLPVPVLLAGLKGPRPGPKPARVSADAHRAALALSALYLALVLLALGAYPFTADLQLTTTLNRFLPAFTALQPIVAGVLGSVYGRGEG